MRATILDNSRTVHPPCHVVLALYLLVQRARVQ